MSWDSEHTGYHYFTFAPKEDLLARGDHEFSEWIDAASGAVRAVSEAKFPDQRWAASSSHDLTRLACKQNHKPVVIEFAVP